MSSFFTDYQYHIRKLKNLNLILHIYILYCLHIIIVNIGLTLLLDTYLKRYIIVPDSNNHDKVL